MPKVKKTRNTTRTRESTEPYPAPKPTVGDACLFFIPGSPALDVSFGGGGTVQTVVRPASRTNTLKLGEGTHTVAYAGSASLTADRLRSADEGKVRLTPYETRLLEALNDKYSEVYIEERKIDCARVVRECCHKPYFGRRACVKMQNAFADAADLVWEAWSSQTVATDKTFDRLKRADRSVPSDLVNDVVSALDAARAFFEQQEDENK